MPSYADNATAGRLTTDDVNKEVRRTMRWVNIGVIVALVAVIVIFALQNLESVTMSFLGFRISAPLAVVAVVLYLLGMATGGSVWALMRWAWQGRKETSAS
jgi:lipopolysaccharide assembly protein A